MVKEKRKPVKMVQNKKDKMDESLSMKNGKESTKAQSFAARRDESKGAKKGK